jgi:hypothetical protein
MGAVLEYGKTLFTFPVIEDVRVTVASDGGTACNTARGGRGCGRDLGSSESET